MNRMPSRAEALFAEALAQPAAERSAFLAKACGSDAGLLANLIALVAAHEESGSILELPAPVHHEGMEEKPGDVIGRYKLLQKIGEGGCGVVWMAEQEEPVRRRVALKIIKLGMDTKAVVARFEAERQALAMMDHANIAKVHDAGATETGRPFFVMELVRGIPITKYCDENHLTPTARLELFIKVCQAVQHAHQKGIIHRDLKPSNILVTVNDGAATPKVIDFGIAKATLGRLTDATVFTAFEQFIGTPVYMSPEQAEMSSLDIDTRSDIYSLGVLLYELLTGRPPFDPKKFAQAGVDQIRQQIREFEPPRPSARLRTLDDDERTTIARLRSTAPSDLSIILRGDLDWIVMRCIEKDRTRRYDTANGLAMDIQRYLRNEPVVARPPSTAYLLGKLIRRHRVGFGAGATIVFSLLAAAVISTDQAVRATHAEREQTRLRQAEAKLRHAAEKQELSARQRAYAADMNLAQRALAVDNLGRAAELLDRHRPLPDQIDLRGWEWRYLRQLCASNASGTLARGAQSISAIAPSPDGKWVAIAEHDGGGLVLCDLRTRERTRLPAGDGHVRASFSSNSALLAVATETHGPAKEYKLVIWDVAKRQALRELLLGGPCRGIFFSLDGERLVTAASSPGDEIAVWQVSDGKKLRHFHAPMPWNGYGMPFAATRNLDVIAYGNRGGGLQVLDAGTGRELWSAVISPLDSKIHALAFSPDGATLVSAAAYADSTIRLWDISSGRETGRLEGHRSFISALVFWPDGKTLASASADQTIRLWDISRRQVLKTLRGHERAVFQLALLPDQSRLVSGGEDGSVYVWDAVPAPDRRPYVIVAEKVAGWRFGPNSNSIVIVTLDGKVSERNGSDFAFVRPLLDLTQSATARGVFADLREPGDWRLIHVCPYQPLIAAGSRRGLIYVWNYEQRALLHVLTIGSGTMLPAMFFAGGKRLLVHDRDQAVVRDFDLNTGKEVTSWRVPDSPAHLIRNVSIALSPAEDRCLALGFDGKTVVRDMNSGTLAALDLKIREAEDPRFSSDGQFLVAASGAAGATLWQMPSFREAGKFSGLLRNVYSVALSPDGRRLAAGSNGSESVKLWDLESREEVLLLEAAGALFRRIAFSPGGNIIGAVTEAGTLHLWQAPAEAEFESLARAVDANASARATSAP